MSAERKQRIELLLAQYLEGKASGKEEKMLFQLLHEDKEGIDLEELVEEFMSSESESENYNRENWQPIVQNILNMKPAIKKNSKIYNIKYSSWIAAASVIIILLITGIFYFNQKQETTTVTAGKLEENRPINDIPPGHEGAILTLSNNQQVILDDQQNGLISKEGVSSITKKDGELIYTSALQEVQEELVFNTMTTLKGRQYSLVLSDGSKVWLNAASSITFPVAFSANERKVIITGEVYFEVAHNASKPFIVQKDNVSVEVLGTIFNINSYDDEDNVNVTLLNGSVSVTQSSSGISKILTPKQQAQINKNGHLVVNKNVDVEETVAWKNGFFDFNSVDIETLMRQTARWYDIEVEYKGQKPTDRFSGKISRNVNLSEFLKVLKYSEVNFKIEGRKIIIMP